MFKLRHHNKEKILFWEFRFYVCHFNKCSFYLNHIKTLQDENRDSAATMAPHPQKIIHKIPNQNVNLPLLLTAVLLIVNAVQTETDLLARTAVPVNSTKAQRK